MAAGMMSARGGRKALDLLALVDVQHLDHVVDVGKVLDGQIIVMHRVEGIFLDELADFEKVSERAAHADHLRFGIDLLQPGLFLQLFGEKFLDFFRRFLGGCSPPQNRSVSVTAPKGRVAKLSMFLLL